MHKTLLITFISTVLTSCSAIEYKQSEIPGPDTSIKPLFTLEKEEKKSDKKTSGMTQRKKIPYCQTPKTSCFPVAGAEGASCWCYGNAGLSFKSPSEQISYGTIVIIDSVSF